MTDAAAPMGFNYNNMADTTNATYDGGIDVPHECLSDAKISIVFETSKISPYFLIKTKRDGFNTHLSYVLSYYNNYISIYRNTRWLQNLFCQ